MKGHWVEVRAPQGNVRGWWKIEAAVNAPAVQERVCQIVTQDATAYSGYLVASAQTLDEHFGASNITYEHDKHVFPARYANGQWQFDNNGKFITFTPHPSDRVFASFTKDTTQITGLQLMECGPSGCGQVNGIPVAPLSSGRVIPNSDTGQRSNPAEFYVMGLVVPSGSPVITLEDTPGSPVTVAAGDTIQGVYRLDSVVRSSGVKLASVDPILAPNHAPPAGTIALAADQSSSVLAGSTINVDVSASDVQGLSRVVLKASGPVVSGSLEQTKSTGNVTSYSTQFQVAVLPSAAPGSTVTIWAEIYDEIGSITKTAILTVGIEADTVKPVINSITVSPASANLSYLAITPLTIAVVATDDVGISKVKMTVNGVATTDSTAPYAFTLTTPDVSVETQQTLTFEAMDLGGNLSVPEARVITIVPRVLESVTVDALSVYGGASVNGTVTLSEPAPAGGAVVLLSTSDSNVANVPPSVVVPEGLTTAVFTVATTQVGATTTVAITGIYGATRSATLTVETCSSMVVSTPASAPLTTVWMDDAVPVGATESGTGSFTSTYSASGTNSVQIPSGSGLRHWSFSGATPTLPVGASDYLVTYALINPCDPPRQILLAWNDGVSEYRASWGDDLIENTVAHKRISSMPPGGQWARLEVLAASIGAAGKTMTGLSVKTYDGEAWFDRVGTAACALGQVAQPQAGASEQVWFDDDYPVGSAVTQPDGVWNTQWTWDDSQSASGTSSHRDPAKSGVHAHSFQSATEGLYVAPGDVLFTYVLIDPCNPPREVMLGFNTGSGWQYHAYWGEDLIDSGAPGTPGRYRLGSLPEAGEWLRLEVPAAVLGLEGQTVRGMEFILYDGQAWFDRSGKFSRVNIAVGKVATQSSTGYGGHAPRAVDGNTSGNWSDNSVTHTNGGAQEWWQVDLGSVQPIESIQLWNRTDCCSNRLSNFWLFVSDNEIVGSDVASILSDPDVSSFAYPGQAGVTANFPIHRAGRYVRVQLAGTDYLSLAEVQVWAPASDTRANLAGGRAASQSSAEYAGEARRATDGRTNGDLNAALSVTQTRIETQPWWEADLGSVQPISSIDLWNRTDCCSSRLTNFYLFVSDVPFTSRDLSATIAQPGVAILHHGTATSVGHSFEVNRTARYMRVQLSITDALSLAEVQVWSQTRTLRPLSVHVGDDAGSSALSGSSLASSR